MLFSVTIDRVKQKLAESIMTRVAGSTSASYV